MDQSKLAQSVHKTEHHKSDHNVTRRERGVSRESSTMPVYTAPVNTPPRARVGRLLNPTQSPTKTCVIFTSQRHECLMQHFGDCSLPQLQDLHTLSCRSTKIPSPFTATYSSLSADDNDTSCCFLVHTVRQCPSLMMTPTKPVNFFTVDVQHSSISKPHLITPAQW